ncbi:glycosyltransferase family 39 protein [Paludisphaera soli]|uniref:glycosyltransferase family 39 protein n=1 Tax=Paludisphaera soli TaxID=2712865 RepID=UPI0013EBD663|nr:glycosyltransferase family 39 protein [Paludisphaera soli]
MKPTDRLAEARSTRREGAFVAATTMLALIVRIWGLGRLGLVHFDEGIYAIAGLWPLGPGGMDPLVIPYAPAGFPGLVGLAYLLLGPSDVAAILVSVATGTLAVPIAAWLARRTFGPGAGAAAAALVALSGFHVAFSRMALTDATFELAWLLGLIAGQRFLERPGAVSAIGLGAATGLAQLVKYSGWTVGVAVILAVAAISAFDASRRNGDFQTRAWGWGSLAALVAALVYAPWFRFVEAHGGYAGLMAHHRSYMGSAATWLPHWSLQMEQVGILSGGFAWNAAGWALALLGALWVLGVPRPSRWDAIGLVVLSASAILAPTTLWWLGLARLVFPGREASPGLRLLGVAWVGLSILTPFYHPYARLWLPIQALGWIAGAGLIAERLRAEARPGEILRWRRLPLLTACCAAAISQALVTATSGPTSDRPGLLAPSDPLRTAAARLLTDVPEAAPGLRVLARPPVTFYLGGRAGARVEADVEDLLDKGGGAWALVDVAQLRQSGDVSSLEARLLERWEKVGVYPTTLNLPTWLDVDPGADARSADAPLWLLRPRSPGGP